MPVAPDAFRRQVHDQALDVAEQMLLADGWERLRFGAVATAVGVSRPTLYAAFANKEVLAEAVVLRETGRFLDGIRATLDAHAADPADAVLEATRFTFAEADRSPVLRAVLTSSRGGAEGLLPFLTTRARPVLEAASAVLVQWCTEHVHAPAEDIEEGVDALVRLVVSHLVLPAADPRRTADRLALVALSYLVPTSSRA